MDNIKYKGIEKKLYDITFLTLKSNKTPSRYSLVNFTIGKFPINDYSFIGGTIGNKNGSVQIISLGNFGEAENIGYFLGLGNFGKSEEMGNLIGLGNFGKSEKMNSGIGLGNFGEAENMVLIGGLGNFGKTENMVSGIGLGNFGLANKMLSGITLGNFGKSEEQKGGIFSVSKNAKKQYSLFNIDIGEKRTAQAGLVSYSANEGISLIKNKTFVVDKFRMIKKEESFEIQKNKDELFDTYEKYIKQNIKPFFITNNYLRARAFRKELSDYVPEKIESALKPEKTEDKKYSFSFYDGV